jgi:hypothetical protein
LAHRTFSPDTTTVPVNNSLHGCQSDAGPRKLVLQVETLEGAEKPVGVSHIESSTVVAYKIFNRFTSRVYDPEFYSGEIYEACELPSIPHQVFQNDA